MHYYYMVYKHKNALLFFKRNMLKLWIFFLAIFVSFPISSHLTWRDLQHIVVRTAKPANLLARDWITNGVNRNGKLFE